MTHPINTGRVVPRPQDRRPWVFMLQECYDVRRPLAMSLVQTVAQFVDMFGGRCDQHETGEFSGIMCNWTGPVVVIHALTDETP